MVTHSRAHTRTHTRIRTRARARTHTHVRTAEDWGLANPALTGVLKVMQADDVLYIRLFEERKAETQGAGRSASVTTELVVFGECPIKLGDGKFLAHFLEVCAFKPATARPIALSRALLPAPTPTPTPTHLPSPWSTRVDILFYESRYSDPAHCIHAGLTDLQRHRCNCPPTMTRRCHCPHHATLLPTQSRESRKHTYIGIGFRDRDDAFALKAVTQDFEGSLRTKVPQNGAKVHI